MLRTLKAVGGLAALVALLLLLPVALYQFGGNPLPSSLPTLEDITGVLSRPDNGALFISVLTIAGWIGWATFAVSVVVEIPAQLRGIPAPHLRGLGPQQRLAAVLIAAILTLVLSPAATHASSAAGGPVLPEPPAEQVTAAVQPQEVQAETDRDEQPQRAEEAPAPPAREAASYQVQPGDSLWSIADTQLGDGLRWTEIRDLNVDRVQADGYSLQAGSEWIEPGWQLLLPEEQDTPSTTTETMRYTVQPGDTLYDIAAAHLGDGARYPEIIDASRAIDQGSGVYLSDPDVIDVGWTLAIPTAEPASQQQHHHHQDDQDRDHQQDDRASDHGHEQVEDQPEEREAAGDGADQQGVTDTDDAATAEEEPAELVDASWASSQEQAADEPPMSVRTIGGVGSILAAGILGVLALRRQRAQRTRPAGRRLAMPEPGSPDSQIEAQLNAIADPIGMDTVNTALRDLGAWHTRRDQPLPDVRAARLTADGTELQLYLNTPAQLPDPWTGSADQRVWVLAAEDIDETLLTRTDPEDVAAPWPSLVTLGHDDEDAHLMLDLEQVGHLDIRGDTEAAHGTLAALAVELATSRWADDLQVTLIGTLPDLPEAVDTSRLRYISGLEAVMHELQARADDISADGAATTEAWTPEILIVGTTLDPRIREELDQLVAHIPRVGIAAVTTDADTGEWALDIDPEAPDEAVLSPTGLRVRPQQITTADYAAMLSVLTGAEAHTPGPTWAEHLPDRSEPTLEELPLPVAEEDEPVQDASNVGGAAEAQAPQVTDVRIATIQVEAPDDQESEEAAPIITLHTPAVLMLGDIDLTGVTEGEIAASHRDQALELIAYLSLNPHADTDAISTALWPDIEVKATTRKSAVSRARKLLGAGQDGRPYLPHTTTSSTGNPYELRGITSDWAIFSQLRGNDVTTTPLKQLLQALSLVRAAPFSRIRTGRSRVRPGRYTWAELHIREMTAAIIDVACEAAHRAMTEGRPRAAAQAAEAGLRVSHDDERIWRYAIRAAVQTGDTSRVEQLVTDLTAHLADLEVDPQPETNDLLDELQTRTRRAAS